MLELRPTVRPMKGARELSLWTVVASGTRRGDSLRLARARPSRAAVADAATPALEFFHEFQGTGESIVARIAEFAHKDASRLHLQLKTRSNRGTLPISWQYFQESARIPFVGKLHGVGLENLGGRIHLAILAGGGFDVYVLDCLEPRLAFSSLLEGADSLRWDRARRASRRQRRQLPVHAGQLTTRQSVQAIAGQGPLYSRRRFAVVDETGHS